MMGESVREGHGPDGHAFVVTDEQGPVVLNFPFGLALKPPSLPIGLVPRPRLDLAPIPALAGTIGRITTLAHYSCEAALLSHTQQHRPIFVPLLVLIEHLFHPARGLKSLSFV
jgi:hypothetical protein